MPNGHCANENEIAWQDYRNLQNINTLNQYWFKINTKIF